MEQFDHLAINLDRALAGIFGQGEGGDDRLRLIPHGEIDLSGVTAIDAAGIELCRLAMRGQTPIVRPSACVRDALGEAAPIAP